MRVSNFLEMQKKLFDNSICFEIQNNYQGTNLNMIVYLTEFTEEVNIRILLREPSYELENHNEIKKYSRFLIEKFLQLV